ncbi:MAG: YadA C-terminal domain-containing protein [Phascolarctobacterium sp.]|nr:YadA C-terminal domain-containing protein [Phascolarctobacterium sp.]
MLKRRNLKVLAAAIGVTVMSGFYSSPVWAANIGQDTGNLGYPTNAEGSVIQVNSGGISLTVDASGELKNSATQVTITKDNGVVITSNTQNGTAASSVSLKDGNITATGTLSVGGVALTGTDISKLKDDVVALTQKTTDITYDENSNTTRIDGTLNVENDLVVQDNATVREQLNVEGQLIVQENATVREQLNVEGELVTQKDAVVKGELEVWQDLDVTGTIEGKDFKNADGSFKVSDSGALTAANENFKVETDGSVVAKDFANSNNSFKVSDAGKITATGGAEISGGLTADTAAVSGNTTVGGTLEVTGATTLKDRLDVDKGASFANQNVNIEDNGRTTFKNTSGSETVINGGVLRNETVMTQRVEVGEANGDNTVTKGDGFYVKDGVNVVSKLTQDGLYVGEDKFTVEAKSGNTTVGGTLDVTGKATFKDDAEFDKDVKVDGRLDVASGASIKKDDGGILNVTDDGVGLHSDNGNKSSLAVTKSGVGLISDTAIFMNAADAKMSLSADGIGMHEGKSAATVTDDGIGLTTEKTSVTVTDNGATFVAVDKGTTEYTNINGDEVIVTDGTNKTIVNSTDVSITDPADSEKHINLSNLGQIDNLDQELQARSEYVEEGRGTAVGAINAEAAIRREEVARLDNRIDKVEDRLDKVGAMTAAIANLRTMGYDPCAPSEFSMSLGHYRGETGMALGFFHYPNRDFMLSFSVSTAGDEYMGGIGATWKFGRKTPEQLAEEIKAKEAKKALAKAEAERKAAVAAKVRVQQAKHAEMQ